MSKDVKIEVLYYKTPADVSLEFGLHGDYPLRLLSSSCSDIGTFFKGLKRAVSRSEIIITVGGYGEDNLPGFIARAVGKKCIIPNYGKNGIIAETKYILPESAIPLASKNKRFGGFLLECGPQTIISLTDDKKIRLEIVKNFIVQYITEHHNVFNTPFTAHNLKSDSEPAAAVESNDGTQSIVEGTPSLSENSKQPISESSETDTSAQLNDKSENEITETDEPASEINKNAEPLDSVAETPLDSDDSDISISDYRDNTDEMDTDVPFRTEKSFQLTISPDDIIFDNQDNRRRKAHHTRRIVRIVCLVLSLLIIIGMTAVLCVFDGDKDKGNDTDYYSELQITYSAMSEDLSAAFDRIKAQNSDFVTWLTVEGANIHHPVLTVPDVGDSERYLQYLPNGTYSQAGTLFSSDSTSPNLTPGSTVIYGSAAEGGIFEQLRTVSDGSKAVSSVITADSRYQATWTFLSAFTKSQAQDFDFTRTAFSDDDDYISHIETLYSFSGDTAERQFKGYEKLILLVGIDGQEQYCISALLTSVRVLSVAPPVNNNSSGETDSDTSSVDTTSNETVTEPERPDEDTDYDNAPVTSDIVLPSIPSNPSTPSNSSSSSSSSLPSSASSVTSLDNSSSAPSDSGSSADTSTNPSTTSEASSLPSSSATSSSTAPAVDPMYTWDITLYVIDSATGIKYSADAVDIIAMIIEDEMSPTIDPPEALIAQSIASYNWLLNNGATKESTAPKVALDPNPYPQAYDCAAAAKGSLLMYGNTVAKTNYYAYSAGKTACTQDIWGGTAYPYLQSVDCSVDEELKDFITTTTYSAEMIQSLISEKCGIDVSSLPKSEWLKPIQYDANGLYCIKISIGGKEYSGNYLRSTMLTKANTGISTIRSTAYTITYNEQTDEFTVTCKGYGHGVGMSQRGAKAYAKLGWSHEQILAHFFPGTTLVKY